MEAPRIGLVARDPEMRRALAAAFDGAPPEWELTLHPEPPSDADVVVEADGDTAGAIAFDPDRPSAALAEVAARLSVETVGALYAVTGASGGVGATTVALHLAAAMSRGPRACYVDLDPRAGTAARVGLLDDDHKTWADAGTTEQELRLAALPVPGGMRVLLAPHGAPEPPDDLLRRAAGCFDRIVADVPLESLEKVAAQARAGILVLRPSLPGAFSAARLLEAFPGLPWGIVLNRTGPGGGLTRGEAARRLGRPIPLELPCTPSVRDAEDEFRLITGPWTRFARRIDALASALLRA